MHGVTAAQVGFLEIGHGDSFGLQLVERRREMAEVRRVRQDHDIDVATKLRRAVEHARLAAHEQRAHAMLLDRRKDFDYRARDQGNRLGRGKWTRVSGFPPSVATAKGGTIPSIRRLRRAVP